MDQARDEIGRFAADGTAGGTADADETKRQLLTHTFEQAAAALDQRKKALRDLTVRTVVKRKDRWTEATEAFQEGFVSGVKKGLAKQVAKLLDKLS